MAKDNPIVAALSKKATPSFSRLSISQLGPPPRSFMTHHREMPSLKGMSPGDKITRRFSGKIHSIDQEGNVTIHVNKLMDDETPDKEKKD